MIGRSWRWPATPRPCWACLFEPIAPNRSAWDHSMQIRDAAESDLPEIQSIYAHHVLTGTGTFDEDPPSLEEMTRKFHEVKAQGGCWLVAEDASKVLGYA